MTKLEKRQAKKLAKQLVKEERRRERESEEARRKAKQPAQKTKSNPIPRGLLMESDEFGHGRTPTVEREHVQAVYDSIASEWDGTRYAPWPKVEAFVKALPEGSLVGDLGCGNGKNLPACRSVGFEIGSDVSAPLARIAAARGKHCGGYEVGVADVMNLPYRTNCFDAVLCIAVLHHIRCVWRVS